MQDAVTDGKQGASPTIAVVIPCYNEASTIAKVVKDFGAALPQAEIYVFDNDSSDNSAQIAQEAGAQVVASPNRGKGNVVRHIAAAVHADIFVIVDGDDTYSASAAPEMVRRVQEENLDMLVGTRLEEFSDGSFRAFHWLGNRIISGAIRLLFQTDLSDVLSGYRVLSSTFMKVVHPRTSGFEIETEMTAQALAKRLAIAETPVPYRNRPQGSESKLNTWTDGFLIAKCILLLFKDYKPLAFFTTLALLFAIASLASGLAPIVDFIETGLVLHIPRAILAAGLGIVSFVCLTAGLILDTIAKYHYESIELWKRDSRNRP